MIKAVVFLCGLLTVNCGLTPLHIKGIQIKNKGDERLWIEMTNEDSFSLPPGQVASVILEYTWSGKIFARSEQCQVKKCNTPYTVAELTFGGPEGEDRYSVSIKDGFNKPVKIQPTSPKSFCKSASCSANIISQCPKTHQVKDEDLNVVACRSFPELFQSLCPSAVTSDSDIATNTLSCKTSNTYFVTFG
ncbi:uncharacterized protein [Leptinotarsa decemlineata]|uniref:uncharacterized protein n=1 Tax=Leptinotarsa decemlineata TaxID=7539 RepID=UPI003D308440